MSDNWLQRTSTPGYGRFFDCVASTSTKCYVGLGILNGGITNDFWEYDPAGNTWTQKADFANGLIGGRQQANCFSDGTYIYVGFGYDGSQWNNDLWRYDPNNNVWVQMASCSGSAPLGASVCFCVGTKAYVVGGGDSGSTPYQATWEYDITNNSWAGMATFPYTMQNGIGFVINGVGYIGLGYDGSNLRNDLYSYDQINNAWIQMASAPAGNYASAGTSTSTKGYAICGLVSYAASQINWEYDQVSDSWTVKTSFSGTARYGGGACAVSDEVYFGSGLGPENDWWQYTANVIAVNASVTPTNCSVNGSNDGEILINNESGGYCIAYEYSINGGSSWESSGDYTGLIAGFYDVRIRDTQNTSNETVLNNNLQITEPPPVSNEEYSQLVCAG
jgi:N-acetylneuraminic acid mutarotase